MAKAERCSHHQGHQKIKCREGIRQSRGVSQSQKRATSPSSPPKLIAHKIIGDKAQQPLQNPEQAMCASSPKSKR